MLVGWLEVEADVAGPVGIEVESLEVIVITAVLVRPLPVDVDTVTTGVLVEGGSDVLGGEEAEVGLSDVVGLSEGEFELDAGGGSELDEAGGGEEGVLAGGSEVVGGGVLVACALACVEDVSDDASDAAAVLGLELLVADMTED